MTRQAYAFILVHSTSHALRAEKILKQAGIASRLVPVPRQLSSNCGVCVRIEPADQDLARQTLQAARLEIDGLHCLN